jgi:hypothetical protein
MEARYGFAPGTQRGHPPSSLPVDQTRALAEHIDACHRGEPAPAHVLHRMDDPVAAVQQQPARLHFACPPAVAADSPSPLLPRAPASSPVTLCAYRSHAAAALSAVLSPQTPSELWPATASATAPPALLPAHVAPAGPLPMWSPLFRTAPQPFWTAAAVPHTVEEAATRPTSTSSKTGAALSDEEEAQAARMR